MYRFWPGGVGEGGIGASAGGGGGFNDVIGWANFTGGTSGTKPLACTTADGLTWAIGYGSGDVPVSYTIDLPTSDLVVTVTYDNGYPEYSGNIYVSGYIRMTAAQAAELFVVLAALGAAANGVAIEVVDAASVKAAGGAVSNRPVRCRWALDQFDVEGHTSWADFSAPTYTGTGSGTAQVTFEAPGFLLGKRNVAELYVHATQGGDDAVDNAFTLEAQLNGSAIGRASTVSADFGGIAAQWRLHGNNSTTQQLAAGSATGSAPSTTGGFGASNSTGAAQFFNTAVNVLTTLLTFTVSIPVATTTGASGEVTIRKASLRFRGA